MLAAGTYPADLDKAKLLVAGIGQIQSLQPSDYYKANSASGIMVGIKTQGYFGISYTHLNLSYTDKVDSDIVLSNTFDTLGVFAALPVPNIFEIFLGYGIGQNTLLCNTDHCGAAYGNNLTITKTSAATTHSYALFGIWFGQIYHLDFGYHLFNGGTFVLAHPSFGQRTIDNRFSAMSLGVSVAF